MQQGNPNGGPPVVPEYTFKTFSFQLDNGKTVKATKVEETLNNLSLVGFQVMNIFQAIEDGFLIVTAMLMRPRQLKVQPVAGRLVEK